MTIKSGLELYEPKVKIDLSGPNGNVFVLIKTAMTWAKKYGKDGEALRTEMMSGTYEDAVAVFDREYGDFCDIYMPKTARENDLVSKATVDIKYP